jgi:hypothetical protein
VRLPIQAESKSLKSEFNGRSMHRRYFANSALTLLDDPISGAQGSRRYTHFEALDAAGLARQCALEEKAGATT